MQINKLLSRNSVTDIFTAVYVLVDDYLKASEEQKRIKLPKKSNQKASYAELLSIVLVGEILQQNNQGAWFLMVKSEYSNLFPVLPSVSRFYRIQRNLERIYADLALIIAEHDGTYLIDSKPIPICKPVRQNRKRSMTEATLGYGTVSKFFYGFKLHAISNQLGYICRFAIVPANEHDITVAKAMLNQEYDDFKKIIGDKAYQGLGIHTPNKAKSLEPRNWSSLFSRARKSIETTFSILVRSKSLNLKQYNSFWSIRAAVCRKIAAHNLILFLFN
ncbi:MAG TPA: IS982 family transposase [Trueperaceae bacterium]|nr:IS982 family transposase [Trueperaceae bacterium]